MTYKNSKTFYCVQLPGLPTFYLDKDVSGIVDDKHAKQIVKDMMGEILNKYFLTSLSNIPTPVAIQFDFGFVKEEE